MKNELISCLMITKDRLDLCKRAITSFLDQTYSNKQLIIVCDDTKEYNNQIANYIQHNLNIKHIIIPPKMEDSYTLGYLRNISLDNADGEYLIQWDDDDISHPTRIEKQFNLMKKDQADISLLNDYMIALPGKPPIKCSFLIRPNFPSGHPGTIMFRKTNIRYEEERKSEDDSFLLKLLKDGFKILSISNQEHLFTYCYHGKNTWDYNHFLFLKKHKL